MKFSSYLRNREISIDFNSPIDISIPLSFDENKIRAWGIPFPIKEPVRIGDWVGNVQKGGPVNFNNIWFNPHAHVTHTECFGHISEKEQSINDVQKNFFFFSKLITINPEKKGNDTIITKSLLLSEVDDLFDLDTLIIRTLPNEINKKYIDYSNQNPTYLTEECLMYIKQKGVKNLLIDLPSIDKEKDGGVVRNHKLFFDDLKGGNKNTITELIYVPNQVRDGEYLLNLQLMPVENDAAPSRPVLFKIYYK